MNEIGIADGVRQEPLSFDLDDKGFCYSILQNKFDYCIRFVLLLYIFSHDDLKQMHMHLMPPFSRGILGYQVRNPHCRKVFNNVFNCDQHGNLSLLQKTQVS
jgi:hypothetical protein